MVLNKSQIGPSASNTEKDILQAYDNQKFSLYHIKAILVSGIGFFTDAYDLFIINLAVPMIGYAYFNGHMPTLDESLIKGAATTGTLIGQVCFGILADVLGRKKMYGVVLAIMIVATFCAALSCNTATGTGITWMLTMWRFILGVGIGGDYPLSAVITSEYANVNKRGQMMAAVFGMQGIGILCGGLVSVIVIRAYKWALYSNALYIDHCWRICMGLGVVPAICAVYFRFTLPETPRYTAQVLGDMKKAEKDMSKLHGVVNLNDNTDNKADEQSTAPKASFKDFRKHFGQWRNFKVLMGCAMSWFCLDVAFYGLGLNQNIILNAINFLPQSSDNGNSSFFINQTNSGPVVYEKMYQLAVGNVVISLMGTVPGYWFTVAFVEILGRLKIQYGGFAILTVVFVTLAAGFDSIKNYSNVLFIVIYSIGMFFFNFGPNSTTFIIPGEVFPTRYRSTGHGISAACGKAGAILAAYSIPAINKSSGVVIVLSICSGFMFAGLLFTIFVPETKGKSLEQLNDESEIQLPSSSSQGVSFKVENGNVKYTKNSKM